MSKAKRSLTPSVRQSWKYALLGDVCVTSAGGTPLKLDSANYDGGTIPWLMSGEVGQRDVITATKFITERGLANSSAKLFPPSSVLVAMYGATAGEVGILRFQAATNQAVCAILPSDRFIPEFLYYFLLAQQRDLIATATGNAQPNISQAKIRAIQIPMIPQDEQLRIVAFLDEVFEGIDISKRNAERNGENARKLLTGSLDRVFSERGSHWLVKRIGDIAKTQYGLSESMNEELKGYKTFRMGEVQKGRLIDTGRMKFADITNSEFKKYKLEIGDVLFNRTNSYELVGKTGIFDLEGDYCFASYLVRLEYDRKLIDPRFLNFYMNSSGFQKRIKAKASRSINQANINATILSNELIFFPPSLKEQRVAVSTLEAIAAESEKLQELYAAKLKHLEALRQSLLYQAFSVRLVEPSKTATIISFPISLPDISSTDLHAGILAIAYVAHESARRASDFGHVKAEKIAHMVESFVGVDLGRTPVRDAAGPNDFPHLKKVEHRADRAGYLTFTRQVSGGYRVTKKAGFDSLVIKTRAALGDRNQDLDRLLELMTPMSTRQAEIFATVYAAWNNLLMDGEFISDERIVRAAREDWHSDKLNIPRDKFFTAIEWIRTKSLCPEGRGKRVERKGLNH
jgi:restriction endonuclease S subunit